MPRVSTRCPNHNHQAATQRTGRNDSLLAVVTAVIDKFERRIGEDLHGVSKVETSMIERPLPLHRVERYLDHLFIVYTINNLVKPPLGDEAA